MAKYDRLSFFCCGTSSWETLLHFQLTSGFEDDDSFAYYDLGEDWSTLLASSPGTDDQRSQRILFDRLTRSAMVSGAEKNAPCGTALLHNDLGNVETAESQIVRRMSSILQNKAAIGFVNASGGCGGGAGPYFPSFSRARRNIGILNLSTESGMETEYLNAAYSLPLYNSWLTIGLGEEPPSGLWPKLDRQFDMLIAIDPDKIESSINEEQSRYRDRTWDILQQRYEKEWCHGRDLSVTPTEMPLNFTHFLSDEYSSRIAEMIANYFTMSEGRRRDVGDWIRLTLGQLQDPEMFGKMFVPHLWPLAEPFTPVDQLSTGEEMAEFLANALLRGGCLCGGCEHDSSQAAIVLLQGPRGFLHSVSNEFAINGQSSTPIEFVSERVKANLGSVEGRVITRYVPADDNDATGCRICVLLYGPIVPKLRDVRSHMVRYLEPVGNLDSETIQRREARKRTDLGPLEIGDYIERVIWEHDERRIASRYVKWFDELESALGNSAHQQEGPTVDYVHTVSIPDVAVPRLFRESERTAPATSSSQVERDPLESEGPRADSIPPESSGDHIGTDVPDSNAQGEAVEDHGESADTREETEVTQETEDGDDSPDNEPGRDEPRSERAL